MKEKLVERKDSTTVKKHGKQASKYIIARSLASFLNTKGGDLVIGIQEDKQVGDDIIIGIEEDLQLIRDSTKDGYRRMIVDAVVGKYLPKDIYNNFEDYFKIEFHKKKDMTICRIQVNCSPQPVYLKYGKGGDAREEFFIRVDASTKTLRGKELTDYCRKRFPSG